MHLFIYTCILHRKLSLNSLKAENVVQYFLVLQDQIRQLTVMAGDIFEASLALNGMSWLSPSPHTLSVFSYILAVHFKLLMHAKITSSFYLL